MSEPTVCCLLLTADRQRFTDRAVCCFRQQDFTGAHLLIYDTGAKPYEATDLSPGITLVYNPSSRGKKIGALRNEAIDMVKADVIVQWDSDDWSAANRVASQLKDLQGHAATGFHNLLFLDTRAALGDSIARAWEYDYHRYGAYGLNQREHVPGSSLMYWRETWKRHPFVENVRHGEEVIFCNSVPVHAVNGVGVPGVDEPLLIAEIHEGHTSGAYDVFVRQRSRENPEWRRAPEWDEYARRKLHS